MKQPATARGREGPVSQSGRLCAQCERSVCLRAHWWAHLPCCCPAAALAGPPLSRAAKSSPAKYQIIVRRVGNRNARVGSRATMIRGSWLRRQHAAAPGTGGMSQHPGHAPMLSSSLLYVVHNRHNKNSELWPLTVPWIIGARLLTQNELGVMKLAIQLPAVVGMHAILLPLMCSFIFTGKQAEPPTATHDWSAPECRPQASTLRHSMCCTSAGGRVQSRRRACTRPRHSANVRSLSRSDRGKRCTSCLPCPAASAAGSARPRLGQAKGTASHSAAVSGPWL